MFRVLCLSLLVVSLMFSWASAGATARPNVVIFLVDDLGYADVGCFGAKAYKTPHLDRMAEEGIRLTSFYVSQAVCSASRASLMTGCYANRVGMQGALNHTSRDGINPTEYLLPEFLHDEGYACGIYGKWHLGTTMMFHPLKHGFDDYLGIPYSNDNSRYHPVLGGEMPPLPLYEDDRIIELDPDQRQFTRRFTEHAVRFIEENRERPFLVYLPHVMPHVPIFANPDFLGTSGGGLWGDVVTELDWSMGQILATLKRCGVDDNTLVMFWSDNGPFLSYGEHAGHAEPFREGKLTSYEGGVRVPFIARWPGRIPAGSVSDAPVMEIDILPTLASLLGEELPQDRELDGKDITPVLLGEEGARSPHEALFFWAGEELQAVRSGHWKLHFDHSYITVAGEPGKNGKPSNWENMKPVSITQSGIHGIASRHGYKVAEQPLALYDLSQDPGETKNLASDHPDVVQRLTELAVPMRAALGDKITQTPAAAARPLGHDAD
ncbi:MAG: sulfatase [Verrucomicrobiales bacterium]|nr:sulfatase [Verrucomicrobiales bacterium]